MLRDSRGQNLAEYGLLVVGYRDGSGSRCDASWRESARQVAVSRVAVASVTSVLGTNPRGEPLKGEGAEQVGQRMDCTDNGRHRQKGQNLVELALVLPLLLLLLAGIVDFGRAFYGFIALENAAREGARYAAAHVNSDDTSLTLARRRAADEAAKMVVVPVAVTATKIGVGANMAVRVVVAHDLQLITGIVAGGGTITIHGNAEMVVLDGG